MESINVKAGVAMTLSLWHWNALTLLIAVSFQQKPPFIWAFVYDCACVWMCVWVKGARVCVCVYAWICVKGSCDSLFVFQ